MSRHSILFYLFLFILPCSIQAQITWKDSKADRTNLHSIEKETLPTAFRLLVMDSEELQTAFNFTASNNENCIDIPMPNGGEECFVLETTTIIPKSLSKKRSDIKTFRGRSLHNSKSRVHLVLTHNDFHLIGDSNQGNFFIDKITQGDKSYLMSYYAKDEVHEPMQCETETLSKKIQPGSNLQMNKMASTSWGTELRKYRMAILWTSGHANNYNNDTTAMVDRSIEVVADMNYVCERDLCITFEVAPNPESLIFPDSNTDPYTGSLGQVTGIINDKIGSENFDIGYAMYGGGGGVSYVGITCGGSKAGSHGSNDHWTIVHELGHNMGASHTMNYCPGGGANNIEPGAGNSIMSYGSTGICGDGHLVPDGRINYFHSRSVEQMYNKLFINSNCAENIATNNNPPIATVPSGGFYIPKGTPFNLVGSATDPDGTTDFLYSWEQFDIGIGSSPTQPTAVDPLFQMLPFDNSPIRTIPKMTSIVNGYNYGEVLPEVSRTLNFRLSVRDNHVGGNGITFDELQFFVEGNAGPFEVSYPNTSNTVIAEGQTITATWNVANTNQAPVNSLLVDILLSTDGGYTYPITLATNVANDGSEDITIPSSTIGTENRIMVASADNIFFDISDENFEIVATGTHDFLAYTNDSEISVCSENSIDYFINIAPIGTFSSPIHLSLIGLPLSITTNLPTTVPSNGTANINLSNLSSIAEGSYPMTLTLLETEGNIVKTMNLRLLKKENLITFTPDQAMAFDGTGQIHIPKNNSDFDFGNDKDFSIELWIKTNSTSSDQTIMSDKNWNSGGNSGWILFMQSGKIGFNAGTGNSRVDIGSGGDTYNDDEWHHVAITWNREGNGTVQLFVDGVKKSEKALLGINNIDKDDDLVIGADINNNYRYEGLVDEVRIWEKALSTAEIRENMHRILDACDTDLISCYQFNETSGDALDAFSFHHGTIYNSTRIVSSAPFGVGTSNTQIESDGSVIFTNTDFSTHYTNQDAASVTATKINLAPFGTNGIDAGDVILDNQYWAVNRYENDDNLTFNATFSVSEDITFQDENNPISLQLFGRNSNADGDWTFITYAEAANDANNSVTFNDISSYGQYVIVKSTNPTIALFNNQLSFCNLALGGDSETLSYEISGAFLTEDITITAPSGFEISTQANTGFSNTLTLPQTGGNVNTTSIYVRFIPNNTGNFDTNINHNSLGTNIPTTHLIAASISPQAGNCLSFDGSSNVHIPKTNTDFDFGTDKNFSVEFWTKTSTTSGDIAIISDKNWDNGSYSGWIIAMQNGSFVFNAGSGSDRVDVGSGSVDYNDNEWHHVAISFDRINANEVRIYVDGVLKGTKTLSTVSNINSSNDIVIGADGVNEYDYVGIIEDVRIWSKALSTAEIRENMHLIHTGCHTDLIASYHLDDTGAIASDDVGIHHGTINNAISLASSAPIGPGLANTQIENIGQVTFTNINFSSDYINHANQSITTTKLTVPPYGTTGLSSSDVILENQYWIANRYDDSGNLDMNLTFSLPTDITPLETNIPDLYRIYHRVFNADATWTNLGSASSLDDVNNTATFNNITTYGQYLITKNVQSIINISESELTFCSAGIGNDSPTKSYEVSGTLLTDDIVITSPSDVSISLNASNNFGTSLTLPQTNGNINPTTIYVKYNSSSSNSFNESITHTSTGASQLDLSINSQHALGDACDDGDPCTTGETYDANCDCNNGTLLDSDHDGICDLDDLCEGSDDNIDDNNNGIPDGCEGCAPTKKVLIIGIDGCRPDALAIANTPNIDNLIANGAFSADALNDDKTWSGPGWSAIKTGVWSDKHLVTDNDFSGNDFATYPAITKYMNDFDPNLNTASICHWAPINDDIIQDNIDFKINVSSDADVSTQAVDYINNNDPDYIFLHFDDVDHAGHATGFSPTNPNYISTIEDVDALIAPILNALEQRPYYAIEDWLIIVTTDHGGSGTSHGGNSIEHENVFTIASGDHIPQSVITKDSTVTPGPINCLGESNELQFDGSNDYVQIPAASNLEFGTSQDFTIECRIRTSNASDVAILGNKDWDSGGNPGFVFSFRYASGPDWKVNISDGSNRVDLNANGGAVNDNEWYTLSVSFDRDGLVSLYQYGVFLSSTDISGVGDVTVGQGLFFGTDIVNGYDYTGAIGEVRVWDSVIDAVTIQSWHCTNVDNVHPNYSNLVGYWKMNEGSGNIATDSSPSGNNGIINGATWGITPTSIVTYDYSNTPRLVDIPYTALSHMCIPIQSVWGLEGNSLIPATDCNVPDADNDGVCDTQDQCPEIDDALIGTACDDGDSCTTGEVYDNNCNCSGGIFQDSDNDGICDANDSCANTGQGNDIYVDQSASGANNGSSWTDAFSDLQDALAIGMNSNIHIAEGIYKPTSGTSRGTAFNMVEGVVILGGYPSGGGLRNPDNHLTILSGDIDNTLDLDGNSYHVVKAQNIPCINLDGITISHGNANIENSFGRSRGGGLYIVGSNITLTNVNISENNAIYGGGMFATLSPTVLIEHSNIEGNTAKNGSALFHSNETKMYINYSFIHDNNSSGRCAIEINNSLYTRIDNSIIANNISKNANAIGTIATNRDQTIEVYNSTILGEAKDRNLITMQIGFGDQLDANFYNSIIGHQNSNFSKNVIAYNNNILNFTTDHCYIQGSSIIGTANNNLYSSTAGDLLLNVDYSVDHCSPVVDAGNSLFANSSIDFIENPREVSTVDIGAFETQNPCPLSREMNDALIPEIFIYPNPTNGILNIQTMEKNISIHIYDMLGKRMISTKERIIDMSKFPTGIYIINVELEGEIIMIEKVVRE